jgi:hypothetical protein
MSRLKPRRKVIINDAELRAAIAIGKFLRSYKEMQIATSYQETIRHEVVDHLAEIAAQSRSPQVREAIIAIGAFAEAQLQDHTNRNLDNIPDGAFFGRSPANPYIDFSSSRHINDIVQVRASRQAAEVIRYMEEPVLAGLRPPIRFSVETSEDNEETVQRLIFIRAIRRAFGGFVTNLSERKSFLVGLLFIPLSSAIAAFLSFVFIELFRYIAHSF